MKIQYSYAGRDVSKNLEELCQKKLNKLKKFFKGEAIAQVSFKADGKSHAIHIKLDSFGKSFEVTGRSSDMYKALDMCIDKLKLQVKKSKMQYRTDSAKKSDIVAFSEKHNLEQPLQEEAVQ